MLINNQKSLVQRDTKSYRWFQKSTLKNFDIVISLKKLNKLFYTLHMCWKKISFGID